MLSLRLTLAIACLNLAPIAFAGDVDHHKLPSPADLVPADTVAAAGATICFLEGPAWDGNGTLYFSDVAGNRILKMDEAGKISTFRADSGQTNGNAFDAQGRLLSCEGGELAPGRRRVVRTDLKTSAITVLADKYEGKRFNSPNDVCVDPAGRVWFTDPRYSPNRADLEMDVEAVYRISTDGKVTRVLTQKEIDRPNGIAVAPDGKTLYVIDSHPGVGRNRKIWAFPIDGNGSLGERRLVYDFKKGRGGDGMRVDVRGNLWIAAGISVLRGPGETLDVPPGIYVMQPDGTLLGRVPVPENLITNLSFGGPDHKTIYVTAGKTIYRFPTNVAGFSVMP